MLNRASLKAGQRLTRPGPPLTLQAFTDFGRLLGTDAPIHNDPAYAAKTPFGSVIAQGPLLLASFETWLCELFGDDAWSQSGQLAAKFIHPAKAGEKVTLEITVGDVAPSRMTFELRVLHDQHLLALGSARIGTI
jgi:acyl dehydratase